MKSYVKILSLTLFFSIGALVTLFSNCSGVNFTPSVVETSTLKTDVFEFDVHGAVDGVLGKEGIPSENLRVNSVEEASSNFVSSCTEPVEIGDLKMDRKFWERGEALKEALSDPSQRTVPVELAVSFGQMDDRLAWWAHNRAVLSESNPGYTYIPVGPKSQSVLVRPGKPHANAYYIADHSKAKEQYKKGERCFYSTVKLTSDLIEKTREHENQRYDFIEQVETGATAQDQALRHKVHYMYYGWCNSCAKGDALYGAGSYSADGAPNRLFGEWPRKEVTNLGVEEYQFVKLYVADLREGQFRLSQSVVKDKEGVVRGHEEAVNLREILNLEVIHQEFGQAVRNLSSSYKTNEGLEFSGMVGMPQLLSNLMSAAAQGTLLASQYTPIVLDLGSSKVRTSSVLWGTYFNMAALEDGKPHRTAWLGGDILDVGSLVSHDGRGFDKDFRRISDDGFLVLPDNDGFVKSSKNLFGDKTEVNGQTYPNGFVALQMYANKNCASPDVKERYLGPWDQAYSSVKVWVDANRNGVSEVSELRALKDAGVAALNVCYIEHQEAQDQFGNGTSMRSAFLEILPNETVSEEELVERIKTGKTSGGQDAKFRLAIDLIFKVNTEATF